MTNTIVPDLELVLFSLMFAYASMLLGAVAQTGGEEKKRYAKYTKPFWAPPGWAFAPIWLMLYSLIGISFWIVRRERLYDNLIPQMVLYYILLALLSAWTWIFFRFQLRTVALVEIIATLAVAITTTVLFWIKDWVSGALLLPLDVWLGMATILNIYAIEF